MSAVGWIQNCQNGFVVIRIMQGCVLPPVLFNILLEAVMALLWKGMKLVQPSQEI